MIRFLDSVDHYATVDVTEKWTQSYTMPAGLPGSGSQPPTVGVGTGRRSTQSLRFHCAWQTNPATPDPDVSVHDAAALGLTLPTTGTLAVVGFAFKASGVLNFSRLSDPVGDDVTGAVMSLLTAGATVTGRSWIVQIRSNGYPHVGLNVHTNGELRLYRSAGVRSTDPPPVLLGDSNGLALQMNQYYYIELKVDLDGATGAAQVWVNGDLWIDAPGTDTLGEYLADGDTVLSDLDPVWDEVVIGAFRSTEIVGPIGTASGYWDYDDLYIVDNDATDPLNTPVDLMGDCRIDYLQPVLDDIRGWTPLTGVQHYDMVDEIPPDDDTTYNYTDVVGAVDTFVTEPPPILNADLVAVAPVFSRKRETGGNSKTQVAWNIGGSVYVKDPFGDTQTYAFRQGVWTLNPDTTGTITYADYIASALGYKKQA